MLDHDLDFPIDFFEHCDRAGVCPFCGNDVLDCDCDAREFQIEVAAEDVDTEYDAAPARVQAPTARRPRWDERKSLISSGADF